MKKFSYENQGTNTLLVYEIQPGDAIDSVGLGMITNNKITGLAPCVYTQIDENKFLKYNVSAKITVSQFFAGQVNKKRLLGVFNGIVDAMIAADEYMIDPGSVLLDLDYMFANVSTCETLLICLPVQEVNKQRIDEKEFFKQIMFSTQFDQTENCDHVAKIINYLNSASGFSFVEFKKVLQSISTDGIESDIQGATTPIGNLNYFVKQTPVNTPVPKGAAKPVQTVRTPKNTAKDTMSGVGGRTPVMIENRQKVAPVGNVPREMPIPGGVMNIPGAGTISKPIGSVPSGGAAGQAKNQEMSLFYLLQHYNKENAAAYKEQKKLKKNQKGEVRPQQGGAMPNMAPPMPPMQQPLPPQNIPSQNISPASRPNVKPDIQPRPEMRRESSLENFGETIVLNESMESATTVLISERTITSGNVVASLKRVKTGENVIINKPVFRIGKEKSFVDLYIADNTAVSRSHASIMEKNGEYYIVDTNSTNHTFLNDKMIQSSVEMKLSSGDYIRLANEEFVFTIN